MELSNVFFNILRSNIAFVKLNNLINMKRISLLLLSISFALLSYAQPVADNAVIPVSVNLNSILRLQVISGGNIEFTFTNIDQYTQGLVNNERYDTRFTVASSVDFDVELSTEDASFLGADNPSNNMDLNFVAYDIEADGSGSEGANWTFPVGFNDLEQNPASPIVQSLSGQGAGDVTQNSFIIHWECGTSNTTGGSILTASIPADRYTTNVYLVLSSQ